MSNPTQKTTDPSERLRAVLPHTEVWQCPECKALGDLVHTGVRAVQLKCLECGFLGRGYPPPNSDVE
jgi:hypothetical protein